MEEKISTSEELETKFLRRKFIKEINTWTNLLEIYLGPF